MNNSDSTIHSHPYHGTFITFEGIDGSGKSIQSKQLATNLQERGFKVVLVRDPGGPYISEQIRSILLNVKNDGMSPTTELLLYEASRAQLVHEQIQPALEQGAIVVCDRFTDSTITYQGHGRGLSTDLIRKANDIGSLGIYPDRTFFLDIDWDESTRRRSKDNKVADRMESNAHTFFENIRSGYEMLCEEEPDRIVKLNGKQSVETLEQNILSDVLLIIDNKQEKG
ncbi:dTMP kinase [candidate division KSB1 bacterium]|nr:dTMP kinase [candidate division KSB1 bacterium]